MDKNPDEPRLEQIIDSYKSPTIGEIIEDKLKRQKEVYEKLIARGHDQTSARKLSKLARKKKTGLSQVIIEAIASQTIGGTNEDSIDTASDILGMNPDNVKKWNVYIEWFNNYFSTKQVDWAMDGISSLSDTLFGVRIPEEIRSGISQSYMWSRYAFTAFRQYKWSFGDKYVPSYLSILTPSSAIFYVPSLAYEGWLMLRRHVLNLKENTLNKYNQMKAYVNEKTPRNENDSSKKP